MLIRDEIVNILQDPTEEDTQQVQTGIDFNNKNKKVSLKRLLARRLLHIAFHDDSTHKNPYSKSSQFGCSLKAIGMILTLVEPKFINSMEVGEFANRYNIARKNDDKDIEEKLMRFDSMSYSELRKELTKKDNCKK